ncbi:putative Mn2+ efflux pump MntP [Lactobacillus colini]|uniref:Mn2+ efflux pump MntP n=1 Tax=Lactobacillus colini TaxID=1819254 RepID=A0ABS4MGX7_9LACO|nr:hypothetical protein [Lactobacillus colini]MBP2058843.1 putative Mn2+ efflux pump MntP [Lactobacillus colini]
MQINWVISLIILVVGLWDIYTAFQRRRNKKFIAQKQHDLSHASSAEKRNYPTSGEAYFLALGIIFTISGIILLIWH